MSKLSVKTLEKVINEYNKYRSPEVTTKLISLNQKFLKIRFSGPFCLICGFYDYFDDFKILLEEQGLETEILEIKEKDDGAIVIFAIKQ